MRVIEDTNTVTEGAMATCYGCRNGVILGLTDRGAVLPLNPEPSETGPLAVTIAPGRAPRVRYLRGDDTQLQPGEQRMVAHWDTHPACRKRRKNRENTTRARARKPQNAPAAATPARRDLTLDELATADLGAILAAAGARPGPQPPTQTDRG